MPPSSLPQTRAHVLIVDDEPENRRVLRYTLEQKSRGWTISTAGTVEEARARLDRPGEAGPVDVVLTDLVLRDNATGGIDVLEHAKRKDPLVMVIVFTAQERELDRFEAYRQGAFDCVEKTQLGGAAWREILVKAHAAIDLRRLAQAQAVGNEHLATLRRFFDPFVLRAVERDPSLLSVRRRQVTVAFWSIAGYADLCRALDHEPELLQGFLFDYYATTTDAIFQHRGILDKIMGDVVMALFCDLTDPSAPADPRGAADAALRLRETFPKVVRKWRVQWSGVSQIEPALACGIHTGESLVGNLGTDDREQFTAIGAEINFASRLYRRAGVDQILVSESAAKILGASHDLAPPGSLDTIDGVGGRPEPVYSLRGRHPSGRSGPGPSGSPPVGR
ncbi:MAG: adenylate/guanylate cyclase domain-containing response regulator [Acidobacteriota bacterium]